MAVSCSGQDLLRDPTINKGTAFTLEEREAFDIDGYLPARVSDLGAQLDRTREAYEVLPTPISRYQFLRALQDRNETLFYAFLSLHMEELLPIVYTPTVGEAIKVFSHIFRTPRGITFSVQNIHRIAPILEHHPLSDVRMIVATDSSAILGIGDQGYGGIGICIGKLTLYTVGGLPPYHALPVSLDVGTDREELLADPLYLGLRAPRLRGARYLELVDAFVQGVKERFPRAILQWEDLSKDTAFEVLERYRKVIPSFNDDVQGTGATALAGLVSAAKLRGVRLTDEVFVVHGAGAGGAGVASAIVEGLVKEGLPREAAHRRVLVLDSRGLLTDERPMEDYKRPFAQPRSVVAAWTTAGPIPSLHETIVQGRATVLIGLSGQRGAFDEAAVRAVASNTERPVIFPLSNPTVNCEALPEDILSWTHGRALVATGSPFAPVTLASGEAREVGQGNNAFVFPGLGGGAVLAEVREVTDSMVLAASYALAEYTETRGHLGRGLVYPPVRELRDVALHVAARVVAQAVADGVATRQDLPSSLEELEALCRDVAYVPEYLPVVKG